MIGESPRKAIMAERIRMSQVRQSFGKCLDGAIAEANDPLQCYAAASQYLNAALERLHTQDQRIIDLLDPLVDTNDAPNRQILASFDRGLSQSRVALDRLMLALENYQLEGAAGQGQFEAEARAFLQVFIEVLAARRHSSSHLEEQHFTEQDWVFVADCSAEAEQREKTLFSRVKETAPASADPDSFRVGPPPDAGG